MIAQWQPGGAYLNDTIRRMHAAFDFCAAHGIVLRHRFLLWCQGESDGDHHTAPDVYAEQFCRMYETLRRENIEHCFLIGIGEYNGPAADISYDAIRNAQYAHDFGPIEEGCGCPACRSYSRAYIRHLFKAKEMLGMRLCVLHNLYFYNKMMEEIRDAIEHHCYAEYKAKKLAGMMGESN